MALLTAGWSKKRAAKYVRCSLETLLAEATRNSRFRHDIERAEREYQTCKARRRARRLQQSATPRADTAPIDLRPGDPVPTKPVPAHTATDKPVRARAQPLRRKALADIDPQTRRASKRRSRPADAGERTRSKAMKPRKLSKKRRASDEFGPPAPEFDTPEKIAAIHARLEWMLENDPRVQRIMKPPACSRTQPPPAVALPHTHVEPNPPQTERAEPATCEAPTRCELPSIPVAPLVSTLLEMPTGRWGPAVPPCSEARADEERVGKAGSDVRTVPRLVRVARLTSPAVLQCSPQNHRSSRADCWPELKLGPRDGRLWRAVRSAVLAFVPLLAWMTRVARVQVLTWVALLARVVRRAPPAVLGEGRQKTKSKTRLLDPDSRCRSRPLCKDANPPEAKVVAPRAQSIYSAARAAHPP